MKQQIFTGSGVAIVTPMDAEGNPNYDVLAQLVEFQIANGTSAIIICGTTGEASALNDSEHIEVIRRCVEMVNGRVPVVAGTGSNDTRHAISLSKQAAACGCDALLQVTPYYNKTNQSGLVRHFTAITDAAGLPVILYNVPARTGMTIAPDTYRALAQHPLIVATKEATGDIAHIANVAQACGDELAIYSGCDDQIVPILSLGGLGVISVLANIVPRAVSDMCALYAAGKTREALDIQLRYLPLNNALFSDVNPIPVKEAVNLMGYAAGECRAPLGTLSSTARDNLAAVMTQAGIHICK